MGCQYIKLAFATPPTNYSTIIIYLEYHYATVIEIAVDVPFPATTEANQSFAPVVGTHSEQVDGLTRANHCDWLKPINRLWRKRHLTDNLLTALLRSSPHLRNPAVTITTASMRSIVMTPGKRMTRITLSGSLMNIMSRLSVVEPLV